MHNGTQEYCDMDWRLIYQKVLFRKWVARGNLFCCVCNNHISTRYCITFALPNPLRNIEQKPWPWRTAFGIQYWIYNRRPSLRAAVGRRFCHLWPWCEPRRQPRSNLSWYHHHIWWPNAVAHSLLSAKPAQLPYLEHPKQKRSKICMIYV